MFLQQLAVVVEQSRDGVLCQDLVAYLGLHDGELLGYVLLRGGETQQNSEQDDGQRGMSSRGEEHEHGGEERQGGGVIGRTTAASCRGWEVEGAR